MSDDNLNRAIALSRSGKKSEARELLKEILRANPQNETAWLWFADTFSDIRNRIAALEECLKFNQNCQAAQRGLAALKIEEARTARATPLEKAEMQGGKIAQPYGPVSKPLSAQNLSQKPNTKQSAKNNCPFLFLGSAFGIIFLFGLCIFGAWVIQRQGMLSFPLMGNSSSPTLLTPAQTNTLVSTFTLTATIRPTNTLFPTPRDTNTPFPTKTPLPTSTPIYGTYNFPLNIGDTIVLPFIPEAYRKNPSDGLGELGFTLQGVKVGYEAEAQARQTLDWGTYKKPIAGQEYLAVKGNLKLLWFQDNNSVKTIYPYWSLTLRNSDGGDDTWSVDFVLKTAEGYPPLEGDFWIFFLIRQGTKPYLYFQPHLMIMEQNGIRTSGAYFRLLSEP